MKATEKLRWLDSIQDTSEMSSTDYRVVSNLLNCLNHKTGQCNPSMGYLMKKCGVTNNTIITSIRNLEKMGLINVKRVRYGGRNRPNSYTFNSAVNSTIQEKNSAIEHGGIVQSDDLNSAVGCTRTGLTSSNREVASRLPPGGANASTSQAVQDQDTEPMTEEQRKRGKKEIAKLKASMPELMAKKR